MKVTANYASKWTWTRPLVHVQRITRGGPVHSRRHEKQARCVEEGLGFTLGEPPGVTEVLGPVRCAEVLCLWFKSAPPIEKTGNLLKFVELKTGDEENSK